MQLPIFSAVSNTILTTKLPSKSPSLKRLRKKPRLLNLLKESTKNKEVERENKVKTEKKESPRKTTKDLRTSRMVPRLRESPLNLILKTENLALVFLESTKRSSERTVVEDTITVPSRTKFKTLNNKKERLKLLSKKFNPKNPLLLITPSLLKNTSRASELLKKRLKRPLKDNSILMN